MRFNKLLLTAFLLSMFKFDDTGINHPMFTKEKAGFFVWTVMHLYSAYFPQYPTEIQQQEMKDLVRLLGKYFPCHQCSEHFQQMIQEHPIRASNRSELMQYICEIHNIVNERINKPIFPCEKVEEIWGQKDCGCSVKKFWKEVENNQLLKKMQNENLSHPSSKNIPFMYNGCQTYENSLDDESRCSFISQNKKDRFKLFSSQKENLSQKNQRNFSVKQIQLENGDYEEQEVSYQFDLQQDWLIFNENLFIEKIFGNIDESVFQFYVEQLQKRQSELENLSKFQKDLIMYYCLNFPQMKLKRRLLINKEGEFSIVQLDGQNILEFEYNFLIESISYFLMKDQEEKEKKQIKINKENFMTRNTIKILQKNKDVNIIQDQNILNLIPQIQEDHFIIDFQQLISIKQLALRYFNLQMNLQMQQEAKRLDDLQVKLSRNRRKRFKNGKPIYQQRFFNEMRLQKIYNKQCKLVEQQKKILKEEEERIKNLPQQAQNTHQNSRLSMIIDMIRHRQQNTNLTDNDFLSYFQNNPQFAQQLFQQQGIQIIDENQPIDIAEELDIEDENDEYYEDMDDFEDDYPSDEMYYAELNENDEYEDYIEEQPENENQQQNQNNNNNN